MLYGYQTLFYSQLHFTCLLAMNPNQYPNSSAAPASEQHSAPTGRLSFFSTIIGDHADADFNMDSPLHYGLEDEEKQPQPKRYSVTVSNVVLSDGDMVEDTDASSSDGSSSDSYSVSEGHTHSLSPSM